MNIRGLLLGVLCGVTLALDASEANASRSRGGSRRSTVQASGNPGTNGNGLLATALNEISRHKRKNKALKRRITCLLEAMEELALDDSSDLADSSSSNSSDGEDQNSDVLSAGSTASRSSSSMSINRFIGRVGSEGLTSIMSAPAIGSSRTAHPESALGRGRAEEAQDNHNSEGAFSDPDSAAHRSGQRLRAPVLRHRRRRNGHRPPVGVVSVTSTSVIATPVASAVASALVPSTRGDSM